MDVFETNEERQAREEKEKAAKKQAWWASEVAKAAKANPTQCCEKVYRGGGWHGYPCRTKATVTREVHVDRCDENSPVVKVYYCGTHDPVARNERERQKRAAEEQEWRHKVKRDQEKSARENAVRNACRHLTNEQCQLLATYLDTLAAVNPGDKFDAAFKQVLGVGVAIEDSDVTADVNPAGMPHGYVG